MAWNTARIVAAVAADVEVLGSVPEIVSVETIFRD